MRSRRTKNFILYKKLRRKGKSPKKAAKQANAHPRKKK
jgi:hypothetical protein